jgi:hypothetical protein
MTFALRPLQTIIHPTYTCDGPGGWASDAMGTFVDSMASCASRFVPFARNADAADEDTVTQLSLEDENVSVTVRQDARDIAACRTDHYLRTSIIYRNMSTGISSANIVRIPPPEDSSQSCYIAQALWGPVNMDDAPDVTLVTGLPDCSFVMSSQTYAPHCDRLLFFLAKSADPVSTDTFASHSLLGYECTDTPCSDANGDPTAPDTTSPSEYDVDARGAVPPTPSPAPTDAPGCAISLRHAYVGPIRTQHIARPPPRTNMLTRLFQMLTGRARPWAW